jgi:hypothetical protein
MAPMKQADQPAAKSCSGLVPALVLPGGESLMSSCRRRSLRKAVAAAGGMGLAGIENLVDLGHGNTPCCVA